MYGENGLTPEEIEAIQGGCVPEGLKGEPKIKFKFKKGLSWEPHEDGLTPEEIKAIQGGCVPEEMKQTEKKLQIGYNPDGGKKAKAIPTEKSACKEVPALIDQDKGTGI
ncbi:MAG: hypothetical protein LBH47_00510 [Christensenellaceae bacterium]|jgi:hypothetical protein|nr:hypothetical protein [Christensenellaceae bacterium]